MTAELVEMPSVVDATAKELAVDMRSQLDYIIAENPTLAGYAIVAWDHTGNVSSATDNAQTSSIPAVLVPALVSDTLRARYCVERAVRRMTGR